ncbi:MAG: hypothetical protein WA419_03840 [Silvibacterium sp.]
MEHGNRQRSTDCATPHVPTPPPARHVSRSAVAVAILCACMVLFAATLRIAHSHSAAEEASGHCPICVAIHTAMPAASAPVQICLHAAPEPVVTLAAGAPEKVRVTTLSDRAPPAIA